MDNTDFPDFRKLKAAYWDSNAGQRSGGGSPSRRGMPWTHCIGSCRELEAIVTGRGAARPWYQAADPFRIKSRNKLDRPERGSVE
jgi:hypothetical protein